MVLAIMLWLRVLKIFTFEVDEFLLNFCWASIFLKLIPQYLVNCCADPIKHTTFWKSMMRSFRRWSQICKKCTILGNLRTITHEKKKETRQMTPFFIYFLSSNSLGDSFLYLKNVKIHFHGVPPLFHSGLKNIGILEA